MKLEEFTAMLIDCLKVRMLRNHNEAHIETERILKNNGVTFTALHIRNSEVSLCPTIYLEHCYHDFKKGKSIDQIAESILQVYENDSHDAYLTLEKVLDESDLEHSIVFRIVNREKNQEFLESVPYVEFMDLAITFRRIVNMDDNGVSSFSITYSDMDKWGLDIDEMYRMALGNTQRMFPPVVKNLLAMLQEDYGDYEDIPDLTGVDDDDHDLYVMTNGLNMNGAAVILYDGILEKCAEIVDDDIYIMPCSVHELLFIRAHGMYDEDYLKDLVREANRTTILPMDYLSDSLYLYTRDDGELVEIA